ncbi:hypothetical protein SIO17_24090 [Pseudoalteromonas piscicida]|uniref:Uncharacterized protein n=1 Tax=Pseudoalteromonas piscicida TaxID=43662 RepID=A0ABM6NMJ6_PSEO7|nr:hypothetical protein [Pseudoalteromonas piscicida]ATD10247.1 hypothetical protein PPIS_b1241 [Pseudoalteromonas piscicida]WPU32087.1 hypothetical protein SIO17_24090 [Pseudoalteromonas piscicida]
MRNSIETSNVLLVYSVNTENNNERDSRGVRDDIREKLNFDSSYINIDGVDTAYATKYRIESDDFESEMKKAKTYFKKMLVDIANKRECEIRAVISITELGLIEIKHTISSN